MRLARATIDRVKAPIELAVPLGIGAILGFSVGVVMGIVAGPLGAVVGVATGTGFGLVAGLAMHRDEKRRAARSRYLDRVIGVEEGDLGAAPVAIPRPSDASDEPSRAAWVAEWLTPPPPVAG